MPQIAHQDNVSSPENPALLALMQRAIATYPEAEARIRRGAEIVERGGVRERQDSPILDIGIYHHYPVNGQCPCPDSAQRPGITCKHRWAKALYLKLHKETSMPLRSIVFYASLGDANGVATVWEDGRIVFCAHNSVEEIPCAFEEVALGGEKEAIDAANALWDQEIARMMGR